jgi:hypothetical protein
MLKLTEAELTEPDVVLVIPFAAGWPKSVGYLLDSYIGYERGGTWVYKVPAYIARQVEAAYEAENAA